MNPEVKNGHIIKEGSRRHVTIYSTEGAHCPDCEKNADMNREVAEALGVEWHEVVNFVEIENGRMTNTAHCSCGRYFLFNATLEEHVKTSNPSFSDDAGAVQLLRLMEEYKDGELFFANLMYGDNDNVEAIDDDGNIDRDYLTTPGKMRDAVHGWFKEKGVIK